MRRNSNNLRNLNGGRFIVLRDEGFSFRAIGARVQRNSDTSLEAGDRRAPNNSKTGSARRKVTSARDDRHLLRMAVNDRTASSRQLVYCYRCTNVGFVDVCCTVDCMQGCLYTGSPSRQTIDGCVCNGLMNTEPGKLIGTKLSFQMNHVSICGTMMAAFVLDAMPVNAAFQSALSTPGVIVWGAISYHGRSNSLQIEGILGAIFQQDNARPHGAKTVRDFSSAQHMQLLPWPAYSPDMSPIEHVWDFVGRCLIRDPHPAASKDELLLRIQAIWNSLPQADIQNLFDSMPCRIAALIAARGGYTKY
ncbi:transposable element Tcb2 transposase [Trichonephila clavipes]|nr:transposable element Tcb2 transposase [Trichonephila clavipes]